jgi:hypothetical protein
MKKFIFTLISFLVSPLWSQPEIIPSHSVSVTYVRDSVHGKYHYFECSLNNRTDSIFRFGSEGTWKKDSVTYVSPLLEYKFLQSGIWKDDVVMYCGTGIRPYLLAPGESVRFLVPYDPHSPNEAMKVEMARIWSNEIKLH